MALKNDASHSACCPAELTLGQVFRGVKIRVEKIGSHQLTNIKERTLEAFFQRLYYRQLLSELRYRGIRSDDLLLLNADSPGHGQTLKVIQDPVGLVRCALARFRSFVVADEVRKSIGQDLPDEYLRLRIPGLIGVCERGNVFDKL